MLFASWFYLIKHTKNLWSKFFFRWVKATTNVRIYHNAIVYLISFIHYKYLHHFFILMVGVGMASVSDCTWRAVVVGRRAVVSQSKYYKWNWVIVAPACQTITILNGSTGQFQDNLCRSYVAIGRYQNRSECDLFTCHNNRQCSSCNVLQSGVHCVCVWLAACARKGF